MRSRIVFWVLCGAVSVWVHGFAFLWGAMAAAEPATPRGYRAVVDRTRLLDPSIAQPDVLEAAGLVAVEAPAPRGADFAPGSRFFATTRTQDDTAPRPGTARAGWLAESRVTVPVDAKEYNRLSFWIYIEEARFAMLTVTVNSTVAQVNERLPSNRQRLFVRRQVNGGEWVRIGMDMHHADEVWRAGFNGFTFSTNHAYPEPPERFERYRVVIGGVELERVANPRKWYGWNPDPQVISVNHLGYKPLSRKIALADVSHEEMDFEVRRADDDRPVMQGRFARRDGPNTPYLEGDFSALEGPGRYYLASGAISSVAFDVADRPYAEAAAALLRVLGGMRCGTATIFHATPCHLDDFRDARNDRSVDLSGGYHDAADVLRQDHSQTMRQTSWHMLSADALPADDPLRRALVDEARWCYLILDKHLRELGQVSIMGRAQYYLTDNIRGTADDRVLDGRPAGGFLTDAMYGLAALADRESGIEPEHADRCLRIVEEHPNMLLGGAGISLAASARLAASRPEAGLVKQALDRLAVRAGALVRGQENRILEGSDPSFSGIFPVRTDKGPYFEPSYGVTSNYHQEITGLCAAIEALPEHPDWHTWRFALRRYADFYAKSGRQYTAPYYGGVDVYGAEQVARELENYAFGEMLEVGEIEGRKLYCYPIGRKYTSNADFVSGSQLTARWMQVARTLGDPEMEALAQGLWSFWVGLNPHNWSRITGFGEDPCRVVWGYYADIPGFVTAYPNMYMYNRTMPLAHINECWTAAQTYMAANAVNLDAPCRVAGAIADDGRPYVGPATIRAESGRRVAAFETDKDGSYGPIEVAGGGWLALEADGVERRFAAIAGAAPKIHLDLATEATLLPDEPLFGGPDVPAVERGFHRLPSGRPVTFRLLLKPVGRGASRHVVRVYAANARVSPAEIEVDVRPGQAAPVRFAVTAETAGETVCVLAVMDGDNTRAWELSAVAE